MSSTQKYKGYSIVPWYNTAEWQNVYQLIFSKNSTKDDQKRGLDTITTWQMRTTHLPSGVEGTLCILEAILIEKENLTERQYQILCASSIMRFLNICVAHRAQVNSFTRTARDNCIPDWIISIRHDFAHSQKLPSISLLNLALKESFKWLETTYWHPELATMSDNIISGVNTVEAKMGSCSLDVHQLMGLYCNVFEYDAKNLCYDEFIQNKLELVDAEGQLDEYPKAIIYLLESQLTYLCDYEWDKCIDEIIHSHFYTVHPNTLIDKKNNATATYYNLANLITLIEKHNKLPHLLKELFYLCGDEKETTDVRVGVALWLDEIFKGMLKSNKKKTTSDVDIQSSSSTSGIPFKHLHKQTVKAIKKLKQLLFVTVPEQFRKYFINNFLILMDIDDVSSFVKELNRRAVTYPGDEMEDSLKIQQEHMDYETKVQTFLDSMYEELNGSDYMDTSEQSVVNTPVEDTSNKRWKIVSDTSMFESCALGVIPPQWTA